MSKAKFTIMNEKGEEVVKTTRDLVAMDYRDYLILTDELNKDIPEVEKFDKQVQFIAGLCDDVTFEDLLHFTNWAKITEIFSEVFLALVGEIDPKEKS